jgi:hypothetical protein
MRANLSRLKRNYPILVSLTNASPEGRKFLIKKGSADLVKTIADICANIVNGYIDLTKEQKSSLYKSRRAIRRMADQKFGIDDKKRDFIKKKGFLEDVMPAISIVASTLGSTFDK